MVSCLSFFFTFSHFRTQDTANGQLRYTEDYMADLAKEALALWDDLERDSGTPLRWMSGLLNFGDKDYGGDTPEGMKSSQNTIIFNPFISQFEQEPCWGQLLTWTAWG